MSSKYLDETGLATLWGIITGKFATQEELAEVTDTTYSLTKEGSTITLTDSNGVTYSVEDSDTTYDVATTTTDGLMSAADKTTVDGLEDALAAKVDTALLGVASGVATLDEDGLVPSEQLPSYVDDVIEGYYYNDAFYADADHKTLIAGETSKIYVDLETNYSYRYGGSTYVQITCTDLTALTTDEITAICA